jgi:hypothetical protein
MGKLAASLAQRSNSKLLVHNKPLVTAYGLLKGKQWYLQGFGQRVFLLESAGS